MRNKMPTLANQLDALYDFTGDAVKHMHMNVRNDDNTDCAVRPPTVFKGYTPIKEKSDIAFVPYVTVSIIGGEYPANKKDRVAMNGKMSARFFLGAYSNDDNRQQLGLLTMLDVLTAALLRQRIIGGMLTLDNYQFVLYPMEKPPYQNGELVADFLYCEDMQTNFNVGTRHETDAEFFGRNIHL